MKKITNKKGFTLIELLVVITIIGILATGAFGVYNSQIEKARDATRISDMSAIRNAVEQFYQDGQEYPETTNVISNIDQYLQKIPQDPKSWEKTGSTALDYVYVDGVSESTGLAWQSYEVSIGLENSGNITGKAQKDDGDDSARYEAWVRVNLNTKCPEVSDNGCTGTDATASGAIIKPASSGS